MDNRAKRKAVQDRPNHREKVEKWHAKVAEKIARRLAGNIAQRLLGKTDIATKGWEWWR